MRKVFDATVLNGVALKNRLIRSATWEGMCDEDGRPNNKLSSYMGTLAKGGVALVITGYAYVTHDGKQMPGQMGAYTDDFEPKMKVMTDEVHRHEGKIFLQLVHSGGQCSSKIMGVKPVAPSAVKVSQFPEIPEELTVSAISELVESFATSAKRAKDWGFDGVQLHAAHGFLLNQFLSPLTNRRADSYGGSIENRSRFLLEVYRSVRKEVGYQYPVTVKLNGADNLDGGLLLDDSMAVARYLDEEGIDAIEVSSGTPASGDESPVRQGINRPGLEAYNLQYATRIKNVVSCPVITVGGLRSFEVIEGIIRREEADYVALSRPLIREPDLPNRWQKSEEISSNCISCNGCFKPGLQEGGIYCVVDKIEQENRNSLL